MNQINLLIDWVKQLSHNIPPLSLFGGTIIGLHILSGAVLLYKSWNHNIITEYVMGTYKYPLSYSVLINWSVVVHSLYIIMSIQISITSRVSWICYVYKYSNRLLHLDLFYLYKRAALEYVKFLVLQQIHNPEIVVKEPFLAQSLYLVQVCKIY